MKRALGVLHRALIGVWQNSIDRPAQPIQKPTVIGQSVNNRPIELYQLGSGDQAVLMVAATHGNEVGTVKLAYRLITELASEPQLYSKLKLLIIPCLNPDGFAQAQAHPDYLGGGRIGRFNAHNVDLNRNYPASSWQSQAVWRHGLNYREETPVFAGNSAGSEPEMKALLAVIKAHQPKLFLAFHSAGRDAMGNSLPLAQLLAQLFCRTAGFRFTTLKEWDELKETGTAKEWTEQQQLAYVEIEATARWGSDWQRQKAGLKAVLKKLNSR